MTVRQLFLQDAVTGHIRFTQAGIAALGSKFARAGHDIRRIHTMTDFKNAVDASFAQEMRTLAVTARGKDPELDRILDGLPGWD